MVVVKRSSPGRSDDTFSLPITTIDRQPLLHNGVDRSPASRWTLNKSRLAKEVLFGEEQTNVALVRDNFSKKILSSVNSLPSSLECNTENFIYLPIILQSMFTQLHSLFYSEFIDSIVSLLSVFSSPRINLFIYPSVVSPLFLRLLSISIKTRRRNAADKFQPC